MTSQIISSSIDADYPIAGQDNDSQGFRDNFSAIKTALSTAKSEIDTLQSNTVLKANLSDNTPATNDLGESVIINGSYRDFHSKSNGPIPASTQTDIDVRAGNLQVFTLNTSDGSTVDFTLRYWPSSGNYAAIRLHFVSGSTSGSCNARLYSENGGTFVAESGVTMVNGHPVITVDGLNPATTNKHQVVELWTYTGSSDRKIFVRYLGEF